MPKIFRSPKVFRLDDFSTSNTTLVDSEYRSLGKITVEQQNGYSFGRGESENPLQAEGFIYGEIYDSQSTPAQITNGQLRIAVRTRSGNLVGVVDSEELSNIDSGASSRKDRVPFARKTFSGGEIAAHPYEIHLEAKLNDGASSVTYNSSASSNVLEADGYHYEK